MKLKLLLKGLCVAVFLFGLVFCPSGTAMAAPYYGPLVMVEADPSTQDGETNVTFSVNFWGIGWTVGEKTGGGFVTFSDEDPVSNGIQVTKSAGLVVDFAVRDDSTGNVLALTDGNHAVDFLGPANLGIVEAPTWVSVWYDDVSISWVNGPSPNLEIVTTDGDPDGLAAVPVPSAIWLLGSGLIGLVGIRRRSKK